MAEPRNTRAILIAIGIALFAYALLGNYVALPGYLRFLERGGRSASGESLDLAVVIGATKTIVWMYSFPLGALSLALAHALRRGLPAGWLAAATLAWLALWSVPGWPAPGAWFYVLFGTLNLLGIAAALAGSPAASRSRRGETLRLAALLFFAFATWEVCGLGTTGRMLHPEEAAPLAHGLLVTQSSKLMLELVAAWSLLVVAGRLDRAGGRLATSAGASATAS
jgi:hypothetical protein